MTKHHLRCAVTLVLVACAGPALPASDIHVSLDGGERGTGPQAASKDDSADGSPTGRSDRSDASSSVPDVAEAQFVGQCPGDMRSVAGAFCMDAYEAALLEQLPDGSTVSYPHWQLVGEHDVRATNQKGLVPAGYISADEAEVACEASGKRLCRLEEWRTACQGPSKHPYPYGPKRIAGACNDNGRSPILTLFPGTHVVPAQPAAAARNARGAKATPKGSVKIRKSGSPIGTTKTVRKKTRKGFPVPRGVDMSAWTKLNDPRLGQVEGSVTRSGDREQCVSGYGIFDLMGNRHEWVADETASGNGIFAGGYFLDTSQNGEGCSYRTTAHSRTYHDYSTGFRCCKDVVTERESSLTAP
jgi:formylglycine-generating enzyme